LGLAKPGSIRDGRGAAITNDVAALLFARDPRHSHDCFFDLSKIFTPAFFGLEIDSLGSLEQLPDGGVLKVPGFVGFAGAFTEPLDQGAQISVDFEQVCLGRLAG
jgi:hypothetical protein